MDHGTFSLCLLFIVIVLYVDGVSTAIGTLHLNAPAALVHHKTCATADGAFFKQDFFHIYLSLSENSFIGIVNFYAPAFCKIGLTLRQVFLNGSRDLYGV
jgi:hypothetical protein